MEEVSSFVVHLLSFTFDVSTKDQTIAKDLRSPATTSTSSPADVKFQIAIKDLHEEVVDHDFSPLEVVWHSLFNSVVSNVLAIEGSDVSMRN